MKLRVTIDKVTTMLRKSVSGQRGRWIGLTANYPLNKPIVSSLPMTSLLSSTINACDFVFLSKSDRSLDTIMHWCNINNQHLTTSKISTSYISYIIGDIFVRNVYPRVFAALFARFGQTGGGSRSPGGAAISVLRLETRLLHPGLLQRLGDKLRRLREAPGQQRGPMRPLRRSVGRAETETGELRLWWDLWEHLQDKVTCLYDQKFSSKYQNPQTFNLTEHVLSTFSARWKDSVQEQL